MALDQTTGCDHVGHHHQPGLPPIVQELSGSRAGAESSFWLSVEPSHLQTAQRGHVLGFKNQLYGILGTVGLAAVWMAFVYLFSRGEVETAATAFATACLIALIQKHYKK
jgi:hypothetical protein